MALFVFVTDSCEADAQDHALAAELIKFRNKVIRAQSTTLFIHFPQPYLVKKKFASRQARLIAEQRILGEHTVIIFLAILIRGSHEYEEFSRDPSGYGQQRFNSLVSDREIEDFVTEQTREPEPDPRPEPSAAEYGLLWGAFTHHQNTGADELICETPEWKRQISTERIRRQLNLFCGPCLTALQSQQEGMHFTGIPNKAGWGLWAYRDSTRLLLVTPVTDGTTAEAEEYARKIERKLDSEAAVDMLKLSQRAYPALLLADEELWMDLEREELANMALSPEESEVLVSARDSVTPFPLFINGRAGSGKSTILQYLFADLLYHYLRNNLEDGLRPPVYLTANGELLRRARQFVERLLVSEAVFAQASGGRLLEGRPDVLDQAFREFQPYLLSMLPAGDRNRLFPKARHVSYSKFHLLWKSRFGMDVSARREFGPDISWHVIRSYIKGMSSDEYLEPDEYAHLPENQLTVTQQAYENVYRRVWTGWYEKLRTEEGFWDDQDLVRHLLDEDRITPVNPAVFCDEAQDFTRCDLELLLRMNLFSDRSMQPNALSRVPFVFAGDQFQTLNPTGFRWDAIKAAFVEKFIRALDPAGRTNRTDLNYRELEFNYRSTDRIVKFSNHVQVLRAGLFDLRDLRPQVPWQDDPTSFPVVWFQADDAAFWQKFRESGTFILIVPCAEGEELHFVRQDAVLRERIQVEDEVPLNVLSASRAKGCEYPAVVVYGFGAAAPEDLVQRITDDNEFEIDDRDETLPLEYFVNKLYVAVSRPKRRLVIVDTEEGFRKLWSFAQSEKAEQSLLGRVRHGQEVWSTLIEGMVAGRADDLTRESAGDPAENARAFEAEGMARRDPFLLRQAAQAYRSANDNAKARECRARAFEAEERWLEAGEELFEVGLGIPDGVDCLWKAGRGGWVRLAAKAQRDDLVATLKYQWAQAASGRVQTTEAIRVLDKFAHTLKTEEIAGQYAGDPIWREAIDALLTPLTTTAAGGTREEQWKQLATLLDRIEAGGITLPGLSAAATFYAAQRFADAAARWEVAGETKSPQYLRAKASSESYPQRLPTLAKLGLFDEILAAYAENPKVGLDRDQAAAVAEALRSKQQYARVEELSWASGMPDLALQNALAAHASNRREVARSSLRLGVALLVNQAQWDQIIQLLRDRSFKPSAEWSDEVVQEWLGAEIEELEHAAVRMLARSDSLPAASAQLKRQLTTGLNRYLGVKDGNWLGLVPLAEAGAAIERAGRTSDAVSFYEHMLQFNLAEAERDFVRTRWLVAKERQLKHENERGAKGRTDSVRSEIRRSLSKWRMQPPSNPPRFPELDDLDLTTITGLVDTEPEPVSEDPAVLTPDATAETESEGLKDVLVKAGPLEVRVLRRNRRCNLTYDATSETGFIKLEAGECGGEVEFVRTGKNQWRCESWGLDVRLPTSTDDALFLQMDRLGISLKIRV